MKIFGREIGDGHPVLFCAEAGINHQGSFNLANKMIHVAKRCGADVVKFQKRHLDSLYRTYALENPSDESQSLGVYMPILKQCELDHGAHYKLFSECGKVGIKYLCSPWDIDSVNLLEVIGVEAYKLPSACLSDVYLVEEIAKTGKPLIVSTGMHSEHEIMKLVDYYMGLFPNKLAVMHCVSSYPTAETDVNLGFIRKLKDRFGIPVGYSGHERGIPISAAAVAAGANLIERHFTMDRTMQGPDHAASLEPHGLEMLVRYVRAVENAVGDQKVVNRGEIVSRETLGKVLTWSRDHETNEETSKNSFCAKSPGYGISVRFVLDFDQSGNWPKTSKKIKGGQPVNWEDLLK